MPFLNVNAFTSGFQSMENVSCFSLVLQEPLVAYPADIAALGYIADLWCRKRKATSTVKISRLF